MLSQENAAILARLVGKVALHSLLDSQPNLIQVATGRDPVQLAAWVRHLIATPSSRSWTTTRRARTRRGS